jgi:hypothetical protein
MSDRELREGLGAAARERALTFTWERTASITLDVAARQARALGRRRRRA